MALLKDFYNEQFNITIPNCYWKIEINDGILGGKAKLKVRMSCYKDKSTADTNEGKFTDFIFEFVPKIDTGVNLFAQAYRYAKTLPEFIGAIDA